MHLYIEETLYEHANLFVITLPQNMTPPKLGNDSFVVAAILSKVSGPT